ncbi:MAG TPA: TIGR02996 domain-containing protein [Myxococcales bacterium]|jgi:uncharacterized protein (TIGR02996 family)
MTFDFEPVRRFLPTAELRECLEKEIAALGDTPPAVDWQRVTVPMVLGRVALKPLVPPVFLQVPPTDPHPLAPWMQAYSATLSISLDHVPGTANRYIKELPRFGDRAVAVLLFLAVSDSIALRVAAYSALGIWTQNKPALLDSAMTEAAARGVSDPSAKVRKAAFDLLARRPEQAKPALSRAAEALEGKALALTNEALARLGAPADEADAPSAPDPEDAGLLAKLVSLWTATRSTEVADLVHTLSTRMPAPPLAGRSKTEKEGEWHVVAQRHDPATLPSLLAAPWPAQWRDGRDRLHALQGWPDPRTAVALVKLLEAEPYRSQASFNLYREVLKELSTLRDARQLEPLKKAGAALLARFPGYTYLADFKLGAEGKSLEEALKLAPPVAPPDDDPVVTRARARLVGVKSGAEERARTEADFLERIWAEPDSEELRRVYADWLLEQGDVRGEFISLQCERAAGRGTAASERREKQILAEHEERLAGPLAPYVVRGGRVFERGFLEGAALDTKRLAQGLGECAWATVRTATIAEWGDAAVLAKFFSGPGRRVTAFHGARYELLVELAQQCPDCPLEDVSLLMVNAASIDLKLPKLRRLGIIRQRYAFGHDDRARTWACVVPKELWAKLTSFAANDTWSELAGWHVRFRDMPWLTSLRVLSPETTSVLEPEGWEVRFERDAAQAAPRLVVEAHAGARDVEPVLRGMERLPAELRKALTIVESRALDAEARAALERVSKGGAD